MAVTVDSVIVELEARLGRYQADVTRAERNFSTAMAGMQRSARTTESVTGTAFASLHRQLLALATVGTFVQIARGIRNTTREAAGLVDLADKIGIATGALQELRFQADQAGSSATELDTGLSQFSRRLGLAASGSGELADILKANNISLFDAAGNFRGLLPLLADYADLIKNAKNETDRSVLSTEAFGRGADSLGLSFATGADGIRKAADEAHRLNQVVGDDGLRSLEAYDDRLSALEGAWHKAWTNMAAVALESLYRIGQAEHAVLDPIIAGIQDAFSIDATEAIEELQTVNEQIAELQEIITINGVVDPGFTAELDRLIERADILRGKIAAATTEQRLSISGGRGGGGGGGRESLPDSQVRPTVVPDRGGGGGASKINEYEQATKAIKERTEILRAEAKVIGLGEVAAERAATAQELLNAAKSEGLAITPELMKSINELAGAYAVATGEIDRLQEAEDLAIERMDDFRSTANDVMGSFIDDVRSGVGVVDALGNALNRILDKLIDIGVNSLTDSLFGKQGTKGGGFGDLLGMFAGQALSPGAAGLRGPGLFSKGGVARRPSIFGEGGAEAAVPLPDGRRIPVDLRLGSIQNQKVLIEPKIINNAREVAISQGSEPDGRGGQNPVWTIDEIVASRIANPASRTGRMLGQRGVRAALMFR